jgi:hypothetical protein
VPTHDKSHSNFALKSTAPGKGFGDVPNSGKKENVVRGEVDPHGIWGNCCKEEWRFRRPLDLHELQIPQ